MSQRKVDQKFRAGKPDISEFVDWLMYTVKCVWTMLTALTAADRRKARDGVNGGEMLQLRQTCILSNILSQKCIQLWRIGCFPPGILAERYWGEPAGLSGKNKDGCKKSIKWVMVRRERRGLYLRWEEEYCEAELCNAWLHRDNDLTWAPFVTESSQRERQILKKQWRKTQILISIKASRGDLNYR